MELLRRNWGGILDFIKVDEVNQPSDVSRVRGTVKTEVLKDDQDWPDIIEVMVYDKKPVYFLLTISEEVKWIVKEKGV